MRIDYDVETVFGPGVEGLGFRLRAINESMATRVKALLNRVGAETATYIEHHVPFDAYNDDPGHVHLADTVRTSGILYRPGGDQGGGFYELFITVGEEGRTPQLGYILEGTGIYAGKDRITAGQGNLGDLVGNNLTKVFRGAQAMPMTSAEIGADPIFRTETRGQEAQTEWLTSAQALARGLMSRGVSNMARDL